MSAPSPPPAGDAPRKTPFPATRWVAKQLTSRWPLRVYAVVFLLVASAFGAEHLHMYLLTRQVQAALHGLSQIRIDQTTETELKTLLPKLTERNWTSEGVTYRDYGLTISNNAPDNPPWPGRYIHSLEWGPAIYHLRELLGFRPLDFEIWINCTGGKVSKVNFSLDAVGTVPRYPGVTGTVAARSVHSFWEPYNRAGWVGSRADNSPQYWPVSSLWNVVAVYTSDAPPSVTDRIFALDLRCLWAFFDRCTGAAQLAPKIDEDFKSIGVLAESQINSGKCPDSIVAARMKYLPDVAVSLVEVAGSRQIEISEDDGETAQDWFTDYKLDEVLRGPAPKPLTNIRHRQFIPKPTDWYQETTNQIYPETKLGTPVLYFTGLHFDTCQFIPATPSNIAIVRTAPAAPKLPEDKPVRGLL